MGIKHPAEIISQPLIKPKINEVNLYSNKSFITKAVERTGAAVVTINTQRYVKKRKFPRNSQLFLDPYFERFFGLLNGFDITFEGYLISTVINEAISNSFWMYLFNFDF